MMTEDEAREAGLTIKTENEILLDELADTEGVDVDEMIERSLIDGATPGICKQGCGYTTEVKPDNGEGWCEICQKNTVISACMLAGII